MTHQKIRRIRQRYEIFRECWDEYRLIHDGVLAEKFEVDIHAIKHACSDRYTGQRSQITPEDAKLICELRAEARRLKAMAQKHSPTQMAKDYKIGVSTIRHIGENRTYREVK